MSQVGPVTVTLPLPMFLSASSADWMLFGGEPALLVGVWLPSSVKLLLAAANTTRSLPCLVPRYTL